MLNFVNPLNLLLGLLAGLIVLMYLLKLRRVKQTISSTLLWMRTVEDLVANAPFQKLRQNLLMWLQILFILLLALALARPTMWLNRTQRESRIILVDNSASMNAIDGVIGANPPVTRLDRAKRIVEEMVGNMQQGDQLMLVTFGGPVKVAQPFTAERGLLTAAANGIEPTDLPARIKEALLLAEGVRKVEPGAVVTIISDGGVGHLENYIKPEDPVEFVGVGGSAENRGLVAFDVRESFEKRGKIQIFTEVENFGELEATTLIHCLLDGEPQEIKEMTIPAGEKRGVIFDGIEGGRQRLLSLELQEEDMLATDNRVMAILNVDTSYRILLVSEGNFFLERMLALLPGSEVVQIEPDQFEPNIIADVTVFDNFSPEGVGPGRYMFLNSLPPLAGFSAAEEPLEEQFIADWNRLHPITRFLRLDSVGIAQARRLTTPEWTTTIAESPRAPMILAGEQQGVRAIIVAFDLYTTDWPLQLSFPIFFSNAFGWLLGGGESTIETPWHHTGDTLTLVADEELSVITPEGRRVTMETDEHNQAYFNDTRHTGIYQMQTGEGEAQVNRRFAVNLIAPEESDIAPRESLLTAQREITQETMTRKNREIWRWFAAAALVILIIEWHLYCRRAWL